MKQAFRKIVSVLIAVVVLFSTTSFTVDMHYCGDTLVDSAVFKKAKTCGMESQNSVSGDDCSMVKKNCCSDKQLTVDGQDELQISFDLNNLDQYHIINAVVLSFSILFESVNESAAFFEDYMPPPVIKQIYKLDETYLI